MQTKDKILKILEENSNQYISGEDLALELNISRTAIWKAIKQLKSLGYDIEGVSTKGYNLTKSGDILSKEKIQSMLNQNFDIVYFDEIDSTNSYAKKLGEKAFNQTLIIANEQGKGRGRMGRFFYSPKDLGVYFSLLLKPKIDATKSVMLTTLAAVSIAEVVEEMTDKKVSIKWVNDLLIENKKFCGILTEGSISMENGELNYAVVGMGVNIYKPKKGYPKNIENIATALFENDQKQYDFKNKFIANVVNKFMLYYENIESLSYFNSYKKRSISLSKTVDVIKLNEVKRAKVLDLDENFSLVVQYENGDIEHLSSGEISIKDI
ncbi:MAG TPA: biotin--[acetyl-CoA-carboxylase] ligase [Clostridiales bacterium]|nr:biotin--[acetyl-CoA-carboxylase] ligase [Clostridiales bacterium]